MRPRSRTSIRACALAATGATLMASIGACGTSPAGRTQASSVSRDLVKRTGAPSISLDGLNATVAQGRLAAAVLEAAAAHERWLHPSTQWSADWDGIARCETGSDWGMIGDTYSGGVGFANSTWNAFGGGEYAARAGQATKEQQIVIAERVYARFGLSGWGCRAYG